MNESELELVSAGQGRQAEAQGAQCTLVSSCEVGLLVYLPALLTPSPVAMSRKQGTNSGRPAFPSQPRCPDHVTVGRCFDSVSLRILTGEVEAKDGTSCTRWGGSEVQRRARPLAEGLYLLRLHMCRAFLPWLTGHLLGTRRCAKV